jgi:hypothetical protein
MNQEQNMKSTLKLTVLAALAGAYAAPALAADPPATPPAPTTLLEAITMGKPMTSFRLRYENVDQDGWDAKNKSNLDEANAWTLRSLIGWQTAPFNNFSIAAQLINVTQFNHEFYDGTNAVFGSVAVPSNKSKYPLVADPDYTNVNQLYLDWTGLPDTKFRLGRQSVKLDNVRFVGNVEFRQVMQVFDGLAVENKSIKDVELYAAHFEGLRRINTMYISSGHVDIAHATWKYTPTENLTGYGYFQSMPYNGFNPYTNDAHTTYGGTGFSDNSNQTYGLRADGNHKINDDWKALYTAEYAKQDNYRGGNDLIDAHYWRAGAGAGWKSWYLRLDRELLSSNDGLYGFQTPLATGHLFQGWGDSFLTTPKQGMEDTFLSFGGKVFDIQLSGEYHWFKSNDNFRTSGDGPSPSSFSGNNYGKELDLSAAYAYDKNWSGKLEYFHYTADDCYTSSTAKGSYVCSNTAAGRNFRDKDNFLVTLMYTF